MKKCLALTLVFALISCMFFSIPVNASTADSTVVSIEYLENGDYIETVITYNTSDVNVIVPYGTQSITGTKTSYDKNSSGTVLWSVSVTATFLYNGSSAVCSDCSHSTTAPSPAWTIKEASHSKSLNTATAKATATHTTSSGSSDKTMSAKLTCSPTGELS